jgi:hypothetical protein
MLAVTPRTRRNEAASPAGRGEGPRLASMCSKSLRDQKRAWSDCGQKGSRRSRLPSSSRSQVTTASGSTQPRWPNGRRLARTSAQCWPVLLLWELLWVAVMLPWVPIAPPCWGAAVRKTRSSTDHKSERCRGCKDGVSHDIFSFTDCPMWGREIHLNPLTIGLVVVSEFTTRWRPPTLAGRRTLVVTRSNGSFRPRQDMGKSRPR